MLREIANPQDVETRLSRVQQQGVPNYFGDQRFGSQNLEKAWRLLTTDYRVKNPFLRGMYYSAARSFLFNQILSARVSQKTWNRALAGDVMQLSGTHSIFSWMRSKTVFNNASMNLIFHRQRRCGARATRRQVLLLLKPNSKRLNLTRIGVKAS